MTIVMFTETVIFYEEPNIQGIYIQIRHMDNMENMEYKHSEIIHVMTRRSRIRFFGYLAQEHSDHSCLRDGVNKVSKNFVCPAQHHLPTT